MAKKTSSNAIKKIDEQINQLESSMRENDQTIRNNSNVKRSVSANNKKSTKSVYSAKRRNVRDEGVSVTKTSSPKRTSSKNIRDDIIVTPKKSSRKSTNSSTIKPLKDEKTKTNLKEISTKRNRKNKTTYKSKKDLIAEVNKILAVSDEKDVADEKPIEEFSFVESTEEKQLDSMQNPKEEIREDIARKQEDVQNEDDVHVVDSSVEETKESGNPEIDEMKEIIENQNDEMESLVSDIKESTDTEDLVDNELDELKSPVDEMKEVIENRIDEMESLVEKITESIGDETSEEHLSEDKDDKFVEDTINSSGEDIKEVFDDEVHDIEEEVLTPEKEFEERVDKELALTDEKKDELESKIRDFLEAEDEKEIHSPSVENNLDDIDVIKFSDRAKSSTPLERGKTLKKKPFDKGKQKLEKSVELDHIDSLEEYKIVEDFKKDITPRNDFKRKRKGKGYVVSIPKKTSYKKLESDLRSLYDTVNDVVDDFEVPKKRFESETTENKKRSTKKNIFLVLKKKVDLILQKNKKESSGSIQQVPKKKFVFKFKKAKKDFVPRTVQPVPKKKFEFKFKKTKKDFVPGTVQPVPKKVKPIHDVATTDIETGYEKPSILDFISQRVLNFFLIVLFTIFVLMVIAFISFIIYVSTF